MFALFLNYFSFNLASSKNFLKITKLLLYQIKKRIPIKFNWISFKEKDHSSLFTLVDSFKAYRVYDKIV